MKRTLLALTLVPGLTSGCMTSSMWKDGFKTETTPTGASVATTIALTPVTVVEDVQLTSASVALSPVWIPALMFSDFH